jgi:peptide/nickel transport system substrate-binding protein
MGKKKIIWLLISCLMVTALLVTSCGGGDTDDGVVEDGDGDGVVDGGDGDGVIEDGTGIGDGIVTVIDSLGREVEKPRYGGSFNFSRTTDIRGFDDTLGGYQTYTKRLTHDELYTGDYTLGPTGTGVTTWSVTGSMKWSDEVPLAATSFEHPEPGILRWTIRQGIYFHDKPPVNGREMTAHDVIASIERLFTIPTSYLQMTYPVGKRPISYTAVDDWTVELEVPEDNWGALRNVISDFIAIEAEENIEANDNDLDNWEIDIGTGPYMLTDYVPVSSLTFEKNPNYWRKHPLYPEDTMPYIDTVNIYILADVSTRLAAFRTGKIETMPGVGWEDWEDFMRTNPETKYIEFPPTGNGAIYMGGQARTALRRHQGQVRVDAGHRPR